MESNRRRVSFKDLTDARLILPGELLMWHRPRRGETLIARATEEGRILLEDGRAFDSPSKAAASAAGIRAYDGWVAWRLGGVDGPYLDELRNLLRPQRGQTILARLDWAARPFPITAESLHSFRLAAWERSGRARRERKVLLSAWMDGEPMQNAHGEKSDTREERAMVLILRRDNQVGLYRRLKALATRARDKS